jgi:hypothetical protein
MNDMRGDPVPGPTGRTDPTTSAVSPPLAGDWESIAISGSGTRIALANIHNEISVWEWLFLVEEPEWVQVGDSLRVVMDADGAQPSNEIATLKIILKLSSDGQTLAIGLELRSSLASTYSISIFQLEDNSDR